MVKYQKLFQTSNNAWSYCCYRKAWAASMQTFTLWQQATIEITRCDHSLHIMLVITFNRSNVVVSIGRAYTPRSLLLLVRAAYIWVLFFTHIFFMMNRAFSTMPAERLQHYISFTFWRQCASSGCDFLSHLVTLAFICNDRTHFAQNRQQTHYITVCGKFLAT